MTQVRYIVPAKCCLITRRTMERRFFLRPSPRVRHIFNYVLAWACLLVGVKLVAAYCASNHYHLVLYDPRGRAPYFAQLFNGLLARVMNSQLGRVGCALWDNRPVNICSIEDEEGLLDALAYVAANPVQDGLVKHGKNWPGVRTRPDQLGTSRRVSRPDIRFFTKKSKMALEYELKLEVPPILDRWDSDDLKAELNRRVEAKEEEARAAMKKAHRKFKGVRAVKSVSRNKAATKRERHGAANMRIPHIISGCAQLRVQAIIRLAAFRDSYRAALKAYADGDRDVEFPYGTYKLAHTMNVRCAQAPPYPSGGTPRIVDAPGTGGGVLLRLTHILVNVLDVCGT